MSFFDLTGDEIQCCAVEWKGWVGQYVKYPKALDRLVPAVRMYKKGATMPFKQLVAKNGFWSLDKSSVAKFAGHWGDGRIWTSSPVQCKAC